MKKLRVGLNGLGRIGRCFLRMALHDPALDIVAVNDLAAADELAYLLKYDSTYGALRESVEAKGEAIRINDKTLAAYRVKTPGEIPFADHGVELVLDATGAFLGDRAALDGYFEAGASRVLLSGPSPAADKTIVMGVNDAELKEEHRVVSNASCTTNCLAPVVKVLDERFSLERAFMTTVHAYTNSQVLVDAPTGKFRRDRAAALSMIPTTTSADAALSLVYPAVGGKVSSIAVRVPTLSVSLIDVVAQLANPPADAKALLSAFDDAAAGALKGVLAVERGELVSIDFKGSPYSSIVDAPSCRVSGNLVKVVAWYDNEWGYISRLADLAKRMA